MKDTPENRRAVAHEMVSDWEALMSAARRLLERIERVPKGQNQVWDAWREWLTDLILEAEVESTIAFDNAEGKDPLLPVAPPPRPEVEP